jgi:hypothetical protein
VLHRVGIVDAWRRKVLTPARKSSSLAAQNREEGRRERRGGREGLIGEVLMAIYSREINGGVTPATVSETERGRVDCGEEDDGSDGWDPGDREREERDERGGLVRAVRCWAPGRPKWAGLFLFFCSVFYKPRFSDILQIVNLQEFKHSFK